MHFSDILTVIFIVLTFWTLLKKGLSSNRKNQRTGISDDDMTIEQVSPDITVVDERRVLHETAEDSVLETEAEEHFKSTPVEDFTFHQAGFYKPGDKNHVTAKTIHPEAEDFNPENVRRALIMNEILSPPLSRRKPGINRHRA